MPDFLIYNTLEHGKYPYDFDADETSARHHRNTGKGKFDKNTGNIGHSYSDVIR
ncbi:MAG: hypothetical protein IJ151_05340 [Bacteroidales bacterium]|nr:hypothetical protein [Bacteroidales bacterium]